MFCILRYDVNIYSCICSYWKVVRSLRYIKWRANRDLFYPVKVVCSYRHRYVTNVAFVPVVIVRVLLSLDEILCCTLYNLYLNKKKSCKYLFPTS